MHLLNEIRQERNLFKNVSVLSFSISFFLSFLNMKKTPVLKVLTHYSFKNYNKNDRQSVHVIRSCVRAYVRSFVRSFVHSFIHSFIHSLRYSMSVNYLKILLDKLMVLIISMSSGIIRRCPIIFSTDRQQTR